MVNVCKGTCVKFKATGYEGKHRYEKGQKLCSICAEFLTWEGIRCPCCSVKLRCTPRGNRSRKEIHEKWLLYNCKVYLLSIKDDYIH